MLTLDQSAVQSEPKKAVSPVISYVPVSFYAAVLGLAGFAIAMQKIEQLVGLPVDISRYVVYLALMVFAAISLLYLMKIVLSPEEVKSEFRHPIKMNFFATFSISLLLFSAALVEMNVMAARILWVLGVILHLSLTLIILSFWIQNHKLEINHLNPAWFLPVVGNIIVPIAGVSLFSPEISWFFFSIGIVFWVILFAILFNRLIFQSPLPEKLLPTFFILLAPPAVGFISYVKLIDLVNDFARVLYYFALFMFILLLAQVKYIYRAKFFLSWWAYSFPVASITIATVLMFRQTGMVFFQGLAYFLFLILSVIIAGLLIKTIRALGKKQVFVKDG
jgi:tellurite resistance protein